MGVKVGLASLFHRKRGTEAVPSPSPWLWPSCKHPMTHSFRKEDIKLIDNLVFDDSYSTLSDLMESCFSSPSEAESSAVAFGLRSERLFFEPRSRTSSIIEEEEEEEESVSFEGSMAMEVESEDPYWDFRLSMEEVVVARAQVVDVKWLQEMLRWYLKMNGKMCHGIIVEAFLDLLLSLAYSVTCESKDVELIESLYYTISYCTHYI